MERQKMVSVLGLSLCAMAALVACGGGGGGGGTASSGVSISGVAATGAPLANATVTVKDKNGVTRTATTNDNGEYTISDASSLVPPLVVKAEGTSGGIPITLFSVLPTTLSSSNVINITPATQAILEQAAAAKGSDVFADNTKIANVTSTSVSDANARLRKALATLLQNAGVSNKDTIDFIKTGFTANSTGVDKVFDLYQIGSQANSSARDLVIVDKSQGTTTVVLASESNPTPIAGSEGSDALDLAALRAWASSFNAAITAPNKAGLADLFSPSFKHNGQTKTGLVANIDASARLKNFSVTGCKPVSLGGGTVPSCVVAGENNGGPFSMRFVWDSTTSKWLAYGNQNAFDFSMTPMLKGWYRNNAGTADENTFFAAVALNSDGTDNWAQASSNSSYKGMKISYTLDSTQASPSYTLLATFAKYDTCTNNMMVVSSTDCSSHVPLSFTDAAAIETARAAGKFKVKVEGFTTNVTTGEPAVTFYSEQRGMSALLTSNSQLSDVRELAAVRFNGPDQTGKLTFSATNASGFGLWENTANGGKGGFTTEASSVTGVKNLGGQAFLLDSQSWNNAYLGGEVRYGKGAVKYLVMMKNPTAVAK